MSADNSRPVVLEPGSGERISVGASTLSIKAETATTGGTFFMSETEIEPGFPGPPPHRHEHQHARVRSLNISTPGGFEGYMRERGAAFSGGPAPSPAQMAEIASRYDFRPAPPPGR